jgi:hypothetical protein
MKSCNSIRCRRAEQVPTLLLSAFLETRYGNEFPTQPPRGLAQRAFITSQNSNTRLGDTVSSTAVVTIPVVFNPYGVVVSPDGRGAYLWSFV